MGIVDKKDCYTRIVKMTKRAGRKKSPGKPTKGKPSRSLAPKATGSDKTESFFWPELTAQREQEANAAGKGVVFKRIADARLEIRAVNERWPIPSTLRERMVFENARVLVDPQASARDKLLASKILIAMDQVNTKPKDLPVQVQAAPNITVNQILAMIDTAGSDDLDFRDHKVLPGSVEDYA